MSLMVFLTLFSWPFISIIIFRKYDAVTAALYCILLGMMFLPMGEIDIPVVPPINKNTMIGIGLILGSAFEKRRIRFHLSKYDYMMLIFIISSGITSLTNNLGLYDGVTIMWTNFFKWGIFFWAGRKYIVDMESFDQIVKALCICGLIYVPLCLLEIRISPQLHIMLYGYYQHSFLQQIRYGGYRPMVFMEHGIMVAFFMFSSFLAAYWTWREKRLEAYFKLSPFIIVSLLLFTVVLCKTAAVWVYTIFSFVFFFFWKRNVIISALKILILCIISYMFLRIFNILLSDSILDFLSNIFDSERITSLWWRLYQEELFGAITMERPLFGWGGYNRGWPTHDFSGNPLSMIMVDSLFVILSNTYGFIGLTCVFLTFLGGPWLALSIIKKRVRGTIISKKYLSVVIIAMIVVFYSIDCLINAMDISLCYYLCGSLYSFVELMQAERKKMAMKINIIKY